MAFENEFLDRFVDNLGALMGDRCEIVIHDFSNGYDKTVVKILNGHITGRNIGSPPTNLFFEQLGKGEWAFEDMPVYFTKADDGRIIKSSTTFIRGKRKKVTGAVCINLDVTELLKAEAYLHELVKYDEKEDNELYVDNLGQLVDHYLEQVETEIGKPANKMNKSEKIKAITFLDQKGVFQMSKASIRLCKFFDISKFTLYNYRDEGKNGSEEPELLEEF